MIRSMCHWEMKYKDIKNKKERENRAVVVPICIIEQYTRNVT